MMTMRKRQSNNWRAKNTDPELQANHIVCLGAITQVTILQFDLDKDVNNPDSVRGGVPSKDDVNKNPTDL